MAGLVEGIDHLADKLSVLEFEDTPLRVVKRLEDVNPPCIWLALEQVDHSVLDSTVKDLLIRIFLVSRAVDEYRALVDFDDLVDDVLSVIAPSEATTVVSLSIPSQQSPLAALRMSTILTAS